MPKKTISEQNLKAMKSTIINGGYNLLLGAGASRGSSDKNGNPLPLSEDLRLTLISKKKLRESSSLARAYASLSPSEVQTEITDALSSSKAGSALKKLARFFWKRIYTLNVDDALEDAYEQAPGVQSNRLLTHKTPYQNPTNVNEVQIIHVHGCTRSAEDGYVFSLQEYASVMGPGNSWVSVLSQTISSECFIIAGTILEEPDIEYFLSGRTKATTRLDRAPSFLVEPFPDAGTIGDCERHGLELFEGTMEEFFDILDAEFSARPFPNTVASNLTPVMFNGVVTPREIALMSRDIYYLSPTIPTEDLDFGFYVGRQATFLDIGLERDVPRTSSQNLKSLIKLQFDKKTESTRFILIEDNVGTGKSTLIRRVMYDLASQGISVFIFDAQSAINIDICSKLLKNFKLPFIILIDDFADFGPTVIELDKNLMRNDVLYVAVERSYRVEQVRRILGATQVTDRSLPKFTHEEAKSLIIKMNMAGLTTKEYEVEKIDEYASLLLSDSIAVAVCRILHDFRPMDRIVRSVVIDANINKLTRYIACAISARCYRAGLPYALLSSAFPADNLREQFHPRDILPLDYSDEFSRDYVIPSNPIMSDLVLKNQITDDLDLVYETYCSLALAIGFYVNRKTIRNSTPEARLGRRLFDYDEVVFPILGEKSEKFYLRVKRTWDWNSRYWEQLALLKLDKAEKISTSARYELISQAINHARHAVRLEWHPFPLTTLGKVLMADMRYTSGRLQAAYDDAFKALVDAANIEGRNSRIAIHPYIILFDGTIFYSQKGGKLDGHKKMILRDFTQAAEKNFYYDQKVMIKISNLANIIK